MGGGGGKTYLQPMINCTTMACRPNAQTPQPKVRVNGGTRAHLKIVGRRENISQASSESRGALQNV